MRHLLIALCTLLSSAACAATFTVTTSADSGAGSLRDAITQANATAGADDIVIGTALSLPATIALATALPDVTEDLTITGPGSNNLYIDRSGTAGDFRIFTVTSGDLSLSNLWILNGSVLAAAGANAEGGAIRTAGNLTLTDCIVDGATAGGGDATTGNGGDASGGAIYCAGDLSLSGVAITNSTARGGNTTDGAASGGNASGGGLYVLGNLTMLSSLVDNCAARGGDNSATPANAGIAQGGGIYGDTALIQDSGISGGLTENGGNVSDGGQIMLAGAATLRRSSVTGGTGVGLVLAGSTMLENCTISGNAGNLTGGLVAAGAVTLRYCTVTLNTGTDVGGVDGSTGTLDAEGSVIAGNTGTSPDVNGAANDNGFNLVGDSTGSSGFTTSTLVGTSGNKINPGLGALQAFGNFSSGHLPYWGSFVIDQGGAGAPIDDQRGANRLLFAPADIGAVEFIANQAPSFSSGATVNVDNKGKQVTISGWASNISPGVSWEAGQNLQFILVGNSYAFRDPPEIDPDTGDLTFRPYKDYGGTYRFDVYLRDDGGTAAGGQDTSAAGQLVIKLDLDYDDDDEPPIECSTGEGTSGALLIALLGLLAALAWRLRPGRKIV